MGHCVPLLRGECEPELLIGMFAFDTETLLTLGANPIVAPLYECMVVNTLSVVIRAQFAGHAVIIAVREPGRVPETAVVPGSGNWCSLVFFWRFLVISPHIRCSSTGKWRYRGHPAL